MLPRVDFVVPSAVERVPFAVALLPQPLPPPPNRRHGKLRRVVADPYRHARLIHRQIIHSIGNRLAQLLARKIVALQPNRIAPRRRLDRPFQGFDQTGLLFLLRTASFAGPALTIGGQRLRALRCPNPMTNRPIRDPCGRGHRRDATPAQRSDFHSRPAAPASFVQLRERANACLNPGRHKQCIEECEVALQSDPFAWEACLLMGMSLLNEAKNDLALRAMSKAAYLAPESAAVQYHLGEAYRACDMLEQARRAYQSAAELLPSASDRQIRIYCGGFGPSVLRLLFQEMATRCQRC